MAFSTSFFALDDVPATDGSQPLGAEPQAAMDGGGSRNAHPADGGPGDGQAGSSAPPAEKGQSVPPPGSDAVGQAAGDDGSAMGTDNAASAGPKAAASATKKKKGTASAVKAPAKRARPAAGGTGGAKKAKAGGTKKTKPGAASKQPGAAAGSGSGSGSGSGAGGNGKDSDESDNGPYCLCRGPDDHRFMIACDRCEDWFHGECIGMDKHTGENLVQKYICPNCTDGGRYRTRYKKMCSLAGCTNPARIYDSAQPSIFCSADHCQAWWEQLVATLPRSRDPAGPDYLTQEEFMGLLDTHSTQAAAASNDDNEKSLAARPWKLGKAPFETPPDFWDHPSSASALTPEEREALAQSAAERYQLGEEIVLCKKMLQLVEMALKRREAAVAAGRGTAKELCGYDYRLDSVGATHQFARFIQSPEGEAIFRAGRLEAPAPAPAPEAETETAEPGHEGHGGPEHADHDNRGGGGGDDGGGAPDDPLTAGMCTKKKCKPHHGWGAVLTRAVKHDMKELAAQAKEKLDAEQRVRDGAASRFCRRMKERNGVIVIGGGPPDGDGNGDGVGDGEQMQVD